jgi:putative component of toxin-antitoxin plasmid stabilization module
VFAHLKDGKERSFAGGEGIFEIREDDGPCHRKAEYARETIFEGTRSLYLLQTAGRVDETNVW